MADAHFTPCKTSIWMYVGKASSEEPLCVTFTERYMEQGILATTLISNIQRKIGKKSSKVQTFEQ